MTTHHPMLRRIVTGLKGTRTFKEEPMASVLVTGFEAFGAREVNSSWEAVRRLPALLDGVTIARIPVAFASAGRALLDAVAEHDPDVVIAVGEAGGRKAVSVERVALNLMDARIPDNEGAQPRDEAIDSSGPLALWTGLPAHACAAAIRDAGVPSEVSYSAGTYVCNYLFYVLRSEDALAQKVTGFIHVPTEDDLSADDAALGLAAVVRATLAHDVDVPSEGGPTA